MTPGSKAKKTIDLSQSMPAALAWVRIPRQPGHRFHANLDSDSTANWTLIPGQTGQSAVAA